MDGRIDRQYVAAFRPAGREHDLAALGTLKVGAIFDYLKSEGLAYWLLCGYLFLEYVRPQTIYPALDVLPFTEIVILAATFLLLLNKRQPFVASLLNRLLLLFAGVIVLSSIFALSPNVAFDKLPDFIAWLFVYFIIVNILTDERRFLVFLLLFFLFNFKMAQFAFRGWARIGFGYGLDGTGGGPGWFKNSGEFGIEMCILLALSAFFFLVWRKSWPRWKQGLFLLLPVLAMCGMVSSASRGALLGGAAVLAWLLIKCDRHILGALVIGVTVVVFFHLIPTEQVSRFETAGEDHTSIERIERWEKGVQMLHAYPALGVGYGNWGVADQKLFDGPGNLCHNIFIQCMSELGYTGLVAFLALIGGTFLVNWRTRRLAVGEDDRARFIRLMAHGLDGALVGYLVSGFFVTVMYYPYFWVNLAMTVALNNIARHPAESEAR